MSVHPVALAVMQLFDLHFGDSWPPAPAGCRALVDQATALDRAYPDLDLAAMVLKAAEASLTLAETAAADDLAAADTAGEECLARMQAIFDLARS